VCKKEEEEVSYEPSVTSTLIHYIQQEKKNLIDKNRATRRVLCNKKGTSDKGHNSTGIAN